MGEGDCYAGEYDVMETDCELACELACDLVYGRPYRAKL